MSELVLFDYFRSSASYRVRIALNLKGLSADVVPVNLLIKDHRQAAHLERNPAGRVPVVMHNNQVITQSLAIVEYLEEAFPNTPRLLPDGVLQRAQARSIAQSIVSDIHPLNNLMVLEYLMGPLGCSEAQKMDWYRHWLATGFASLETQLRESNGAKFCVGQSPSIADICLVPQVYNARRFDCPLDAYPTIVAISKHCEGLDAFAKAAPVLPAT